MPNTRDLRRRIKSVRNTAQITKAMQMVAASKMRKAQQLALAGRPYSELLIRTLEYVQAHAGDVSHPMLEPREGNRHLILLVTPDKGLCGALTTNLLREGSSMHTAETSYVSVGRKGAQWCARGKRDLLADFHLSEALPFNESKRISKFALDQFMDGKVDRVSVLFTYFVNTLTQQPKLRNLLPVSASELLAAVEANPRSEVYQEIRFEPDPVSVLGTLLPYYVHYQVYQMLLNARASEHSARMVAMKNATDNAKSLIKDLSLEYNKLRQASITNELLEISTAQMALG